MRKVATIKPRRRVFVGCEGESERSYVALLRLLPSIKRLHVHLDPVVLNPGSGDPAKLIERAAQRLQECTRQHGKYIARAVLLDSDTRGRAPDREERAFAIAKKLRMTLIWQEPCHEALLLRHLDGCDRSLPATSEQAMRELQSHWPEYRKGLPASDLARRLGDIELSRAVLVETSLHAFLKQIGFRRQ